MTTPAAADLKPARLRLWSNWLWILAAILAAALLHSSIRLIHDQSIRRDALRSLAQDKATEVANLGSAKFNLLAAEAFGPVSSQSSGDVLAALTSEQAARTACRCRETLPIARFFKVDSRVTYSDRADRFIPDSALVRVARTRVAPDNQPAVDIVRGHAIVTVGKGPTVYGGIMAMPAFARTLFGAVPLEVPQGIPSGMHAAHVAEHRRLVQLDSLGLGIAADTQPIFGSVADRPYMANVKLPPPLDKFHVNVAMMSSQVALPLQLPFGQNRLLHNGALLIATIVVCLFAIGASRREVALARARSDFLAGISHDLRMPLAQILLASETLSLGRDRNEAERGTLVASILRESRRLKAMIDNVLLFSRSGAVGVEPRLGPVEVHPLFDAVAESVSMALADAGQSVAIEAPRDMRVVADRSLMHQALVNLVDNAMKYGPRGQVIMLRGASAPDGIQLIVEDDGPGIPRGARDRLFEPYERLARDRTSERTGSGLGLAVVRQIVIACRGTVRIDDTDRGARIVITLPAA